MNRPNDTVWSFQHNVDGTLDQAGLGVKGAVDDFFSCASISDGLSWLVCHILLMIP